MRKTLSFALLLLWAVASAAQSRFRTIAQPQVYQELDILKAALTGLHPGTYRYETASQVDSLFTSLLKQVKNQITEDRYLIMLSQLLTHIHCGHTYTNYWNQNKEVKERVFSNLYLPFLFRLVGKKMIITHNLSGLPTVKPGCEVISINGVRSAAFIDSLLTVSPSDGLHGLGRKLDNINIEPQDIDTSNYNLFDIYFPLFFKQNFNIKAYRILLKNTKGKQYMVLLKALSKTERLESYNRIFGQLPVHENNWSLRFLNSSTACFKIGDFETWEWKRDYHHYLDSIFKILSRRKVRNLIIDIRGNSGGDDEARDEVFSYLTNKPFGCEDPMHRRVRFLAIPDTLLPYLKTWDKSFKEAKIANDYIRVEDSCFEKKADLRLNCVTIPPKATYFRGRKFLLTDARNGSTTFTLAKLFKTYNCGTIVGESTSGNQQGINGGQFFFLYLPFANIEIDIPLVWGAYRGANPDIGIEPDIQIPLSVSAIAHSTDEPVKYILTHLSARSGKTNARIRVSD